MREDGRLIVLEGVDGVGKTTLTSLLTARIGKDHPVEAFSFPGRAPNTIGEMVYNLHHDRERFGIHSLTATSLQALHVAAHFDAIEQKFIPLLKSGIWIVLDRFWWSTWVYGVSGGANQEVLTLLVEAERKMWGDCLPMCLFYVKRDSAILTQEATLLNCEYEKLCYKERNKYPVREIQNNASPSTAIEEMVASLKFGQQHGT